MSARAHRTPACAAWGTAPIAHPRVPARSRHPGHGLDRASL